jgi:hypothetical protein
MELQSKKLSKELKDLDDINDADIDTSDIPELKEFSGGNVGKFYNAEPVKKDIN